MSSLLAPVAVYPDEVIPKPTNAILSGNVSSPKAFPASTLRGKIAIKTAFPSTSGAFTPKSRGGRKRRKTRRTRLLRKRRLQ